MEINEIEKILKDSKTGPMDVLREFSVLIPLIEIDGNLHLIYQKRALNLRSQAGEICFPGGAIEKGESPEEAAIRETMEELNLDRDKINLLGEIDFFLAHSRIIIYPFVAYIKNDIDFNDIKVNKDEVDHIFTVPLDYFLNTDAEVHRLRMYPEESDDFPYQLIPGGREYKFSPGINDVYFYKYKNYIIWGFTAKITDSFIKKLKSKEGGGFYEWEEGF